MAGRNQFWVPCSTGGWTTSSPRAPMDFRALPPLHRPLDIGRSQAGPHTRFRESAALAERHRRTVQLPVLRFG